MIKDLVLLACVGIRPVLVHGGGPEINSWLNKVGIEAQFKNGLRVTDGACATFQHTSCCCSGVSSGCEQHDHETLLHDFRWIATDKR